MPHRRHDAHDRLPLILLSIPDVPPHRILVRPVLPREIFVDHRYRLASYAVPIAEGPSAHQANPHGLEIPWADLPDISVRAGIAWRCDTPFDRKRRRPAKSAEGQGHACC